MGSTPEWLSWAKMLDPTTSKSALGGVVKQGMTMVPIVGGPLVQAMDAAAAAAQAARKAAAPPPPAPAITPPVAQLPPPSQGSPVSRLPAWVRSPLAIGAALVAVVVVVFVVVRGRGK